VTTETKNGTILIVDDEEPVREPLYTRLVREGYSCFEAENTPKAVERLNENPIDLTILDIMIHGNSGLELLPRIIQDYPNVAVIIASHVIEPNVIIECMKSGAQDYITKPFNLEVVIRCIEEVLRKRQIELMLKAYQAGLEGKVAEQAKQIRNLFLNAIDSLVTALEAKDAYTAGHSRRVHQLAYAISQRMGFTSEEADDLRWGALLHDVGKIAVDPAIQNKPGKLTDEEYEKIMTHTQLGPRIVKAVANENIVDIIKYHHTRYNADPQQQMLVGEEIPLGARIVTLADSFDAMTSDRPYRKSFSIEAALCEVQRCSGTQFDPVVVDAFLKIPTSEILKIIRGGIDQRKARQ
jgi:putative two-component system response regulator